jgi:hypothetical protein
VIKDASKAYPVRAGQRIRRKLKSRRTLDMIAIALVGDPKQPTSLALAMPSDGEDLPTAGSTTRADQGDGAHGRAAASADRRDL